MIDTTKVLDRILELTSTQKISYKDLSASLGRTSPQVITDWKAGNNTSFMKYLPQLASTLNTSVSYLLGETNDPMPPNLDEQLSEIEFALYGVTRTMSEAAKEDVLRFARVRAQMEDQEKKK